MTPAAQSFERDTTCPASPMPVAPATPAVRNIDRPMIDSFGVSIITTHERPSGDRPRAPPHDVNVGRGLCSCIPTRAPPRYPKAAAG